MSWRRCGYEKRNRLRELVARGGVQGSEDARNPHIPASAAPVSCAKCAGYRRRKFFPLVRSILVWRCVMSRVSSQVSNDNFGVLMGCLVEGDAEQQMRQRKVRRRSLVLSIALQGAILAAIVLVPLLGKPARIALANVTPVPPYYSRPMQQTTAVPEAPRPAPRPEGFFQPNSIPVRVVTHEPTQDSGGDQVPFAGAGINRPGAIPLGGTRPPK